MKNSNMKMNRKKRTAINAISISLFIGGFILLFLLALAQEFLPDASRGKYNFIIILSVFASWALSLFLLLYHSAAMIQSELEEKRAVMQNKKADVFFNGISVYETPQSLTDRLVRSGFSAREGYFHKKQFSFFRDFINYYAVIAEGENITGYFNDFIKQSGPLSQSCRRSHNNIIYLFFFHPDISEEELSFVKTLLIDQETAQMVPYTDFDLFLPVVYHTALHRYILKAPGNRLSLRLTDVGFRKLYKMLKPSRHTLPG